mmetsp:Transcript_86791/g.218472  ORF Transcript_86791/g.218472 Transcript_86791/m.218472 type:complete len:203 (+) Transcript_86791:854-1462(+)
MAAKLSTTSFARIRAAANISALSPLRSPASQRRRVFMAPKRTSTRRSSRPLRRKLATELRCATQATSFFSSSWYSGDCCSASSSPARASKSCRQRSCSMACTTSRRAFSSISISSAMYLCSKLAHVQSSATSVFRSSERVGRVESRGCSLAWLHRSSKAASSDHERCKASARRMASALNSNLSPFTQMTAYCSTLASSTSTR